MLPKIPPVHCKSQLVSWSSLSGFQTDSNSTVLAIGSLRGGGLQQTTANLFNLLPEKFLLRLCCHPQCTLQCPGSSRLQTDSSNQCVGRIQIRMLDAPCLGDNSRNKQMQFVTLALLTRLLWNATGKDNGEELAAAANCSVSSGNGLIR